MSSPISINGNITARMLSNNLQSDTTNTTPTQFMQCGWGVITTGAAAFATETVTFPVAFSVLPIVVATFGGDNASSTTYGQGASNVKNALAEAYSITATTFVIDIRSRDGTSWSAGNTVFYQWIAVGAP